MVRSFGDNYLNSFGLSDKPSIIEYDIPSTGNINFILASDGLWDNWEKKDLVQFYYKLKGTKTDQNIFDEIIQTTITKAKANFGSSHDDITTIMFIS